MDFFFSLSLQQLKITLDTHTHTHTTLGEREESLLPDQTVIPTTTYYNSVVTLRNNSTVTQTGSRRDRITAGLQGQLKLNYNSTSFFVFEPKKSGPVPSLAPDPYGGGSCKSLVRARTKMLIRAMTLVMIQREPGYVWSGVYFVCKVRPSRSNMS